MKKKIKEAFIMSIPVLTGYIILGFGFGVLLAKSGYSIFVAFLMSVTIYAGSMQYAGVQLLVNQTSILTTFVTTLAINARHLFYSIAMLQHYQKGKEKKPYLAFALTDETFSLVADGKTSIDVCFYLSLCNQLYWIFGCCLGAWMGQALPFDATGIDFSMTALFVATFVEQWSDSSSHESSLCGLVATLGCLFLFGPDIFLIPSMILILFYFSVTYYKKETCHA